jgi:hypothetical protein
MALVGLAIAALAPTHARADSSLFLTWDECVNSVIATSNNLFACDTELGFEELYGAFTMPQATGVDVLGLIAVIDVQHSSPILPNWWRMAASGDCRSGTLSAGANFTANSGCVDPWHGNAVADVQRFTVGEPRSGAGQARIISVCGVIPSLAVALDATSTYYGIKLVINNALTTGATACSGCAGSACLVLNSIEIQRTSSVQNILLQTPGSGNRNWARWHGAPDSDCALVPVRAITWGRVKSIYR